MIFRIPNNPSPTHFVLNRGVMSNFAAHQPLSSFWDGCYKMLLSMGWVGHRDKRCLSDPNFPEGDSVGCVQKGLQKIARLYWVVWGMRNMQCNLLGVPNFWSENLLFFIVRYPRRIFGWWVKYSLCALL